MKSPVTLTDQKVTHTLSIIITGSLHQCEKQKLLRSHKMTLLRAPSSWPIWTSNSSWTMQVCYSSSNQCFMEDNPLFPCILHHLLWCLHTMAEVRYHLWVSPGCCLLHHLSINNPSRWFSLLLWALVSYKVQITHTLPIRVVQITLINPCKPRGLPITSQSHLRIKDPQLW